MCVISVRLSYPILPNAFPNALQILASDLKRLLERPISLTCIIHELA
jgi:hypothetical protein